MKVAIDETNRRRAIQEKFNKEHNITPTTIQKEIKNTLEITKKSKSQIAVSKIPEEIEKLKSLMKIASGNLDFELAIKYREEIGKLKKRLENAKR